MSNITLHLGAPSHAVAPDLLVQQLPTLAAILRDYCEASIEIERYVPTRSEIFLYAAQLGVQRDHITLERLPALTANTFSLLQLRVAKCAQEFSDDGLLFTSNADGADINGLHCLGTLNLSAVLSPAANFIGRDISQALPRDSAAKVLRQFVNTTQMSLHQSPLDESSTNAIGVANSLWCSHRLPDDMLSGYWLQGGLSGWWDKLQVWDCTIENRLREALNGTSPLVSTSKAKFLDIAFSDVTLSVPLKRRSAWTPWIKPLQLAKVLQQAELVAN